MSLADSRLTERDIRWWNCLTIPRVYRDPEEDEGDDDEADTPIYVESGD